MREKLRGIVEESGSPAGRAFDLSVQALVFVSIIGFSLETLPELDSATRDVLAVIETVTIVLFSAEYLLRVAVAQRPLRFVFSFWGLVDLAAIAPFYLALGVDLRSLRAVRVLRLVRVLKLARYSKALQHMLRALSLIRDELVLFGGFTALVLYLAAVGVYYFERDAQPEQFASVFHSLWWSVATLTTVGYGDVYPVTLGGRLFTFVVLMVGLGVVAVPSGLFASALSEARKQILDEAP